jgi:hypothetical protein
MTFALCLLAGLVACLYVHLTRRRRRRILQEMMHYDRG